MAEVDRAAASATPAEKVPRFVRFLLTGGTAAIVNILSRALLSLVIPFEASVIVAYLIGMVTAFVLARLFVFERSGHALGTEFTRFALVNIVSLAQVWLVSVLLVRWLFPVIGYTFQPELVGHSIAVLSPAITSYYGHKLFSFRPKAGP